MLRKLFKYELKATARLFIPLYLTILVFALMNRFLFPMEAVGENTSTLFSLVMGISMFIYITLMMGLVLMTLFVMIQRFYKNLLGDEGYLMFTLPVQSWKQIFSKMAISTLWIFVSSIVAVCSILIIVSKRIPLTELYNGFTMGLNQIVQIFGASSYLAGFEFIVLVLLAITSTILTIYAAIALGHLFSKYKLLASFGMYIGLKTVFQIFAMLVAFIFFSQTFMGMENNSIPSIAQIHALLLFTILCNGAITAASFILTNYILRRKLNLE